jgi:hypothetical protein
LSLDGRLIMSSFGISSIVGMWREVCIFGGTRADGFAPAPAWAVAVASLVVGAGGLSSAGSLTFSAHPQGSFS